MLRQCLLATPVGVSCLAALVAVDWFAVHTVQGRVLDGRSLRGALLTESRATCTVEQVLDVVSVSSVLAVIGVILAAALLRQRRTLGLAAVTVLLGSNVTTQQGDLQGQQGDVVVPGADELADHLVAQHL